MEDEICYVYEYADPDDGKVFYVGMGKGNRLKTHMRPSVLKHNTPKSQKIKEILARGKLPIIRKVLENVSRQRACEEETSLISFYGKSNLTNKTTGGQGHPGSSAWKGRTHSEESKNKIRAAKIGKPGTPWSEDQREKFLFTLAKNGHPFKGKTHSKETKQQISTALKGIPLSEEQKAQRSQTMKEVWQKRREGKIKNRKSRKGRKHGH